MTLSNILFTIILISFLVIVAAIVPNLGVLISLIGAFCASTLALIYPPIIDLVINYSDQQKPTPIVILKNCFIIFLGFFGFVTGTYTSISEIIKGFK